MKDYIYPNQEILIPKSGFSYYITKEGDTIDLVAGLFKTSTEIVLKNNSKTDDKRSTDLQKVQKDFAEDYDEYYKPSKWEITKNIAKCLGKAFINDVKSYIMFYPLFKVAQLISFLSIYLPSYAFYKKTGINIPAKVSSVFTKNESLNIIGQNLYNVIPLTLASFMFKWGKDLYLFAKS